MTDKSAAAIREFAEAEYPDMPAISERAPYNQIMATNRMNLIARLTVLISEHYYPKEFVRWMFQGCPFIIGENGAGNIIAFSVRDGKQFTFDELFNYWEEVNNGR